MRTSRPVTMRELCVAGLLVLGILPGCDLFRTSEEDRWNPEFEWHFSRPLPEIDLAQLDTEFTRFIRGVEALSDSVRKQAAVDSFMAIAAAAGIPYVENGGIAHFLYRDSRNPELALIGDFNGWGYDRPVLSRLAQTDLYYYSMAVPSDARLEYKLIVNGVLQRDPLNPGTCCFGDFGLNSELAMPDYLPPPEIEICDIPHGTIESFPFTDQARGSTRQISVYLPPGYREDGASYPTVYFHDGSTYLNNAYADRIFDYLIYQQRIEPVIGVFVEPRNRDSEYWYDEVFLNIVADELVPIIDAMYNSSRQALDRAVVGFSKGGMAALYFTYMRPEIFGCCAAQSPAIHNTELVECFAESQPFRARIYLDAGTYEPWIYEPALELAGYLEENDFDGRFFGWNEYHSIGNWRAHLDEALQYFFPPE